jgi:hypothetical protein
MNKFFTKVSLLFLSAMIFSLPIMGVVADGLPGARSETKEGNVFLGGNYLEVGINPIGTFGTTVPPDNQTFNSLSAYDGRLGLMVNKNGWGVADPTTGDFFLPGAPFESYYIRYTLNDVNYIYQAYTTDTFFNPFPTGTLFSTINESVGDQLQALTTIILPNGLTMKQTISFGVDDKFYTTTIEFINNTSGILTNIEYGRLFDPDQDRDRPNGTFATYNKVISNPDPNRSGNQAAMVVARGPITLEAFFFISTDPNARARKNTRASQGS